MIKKWHYLALIILLAAIVGWLLFPRRLSVSAVALAYCGEGAAYRELTADSCWERWWPQGRPVSQPFCGTNRHPFIYHSFSYRVEAIFPGGVGVLIRQGDFVMETRIHILSKEGPAGAQGQGAGGKPEAGQTDPGKMRGMEREGDPVTIQWTGQLEGSFNPVERMEQRRQMQAIARGMSGILYHLSRFLSEAERAGRVGPVVSVGKGY